MTISEYRPHLEQGCLEKYSFLKIVDFVNENPCGIVNLSDVTWSLECGTQVVRLLMSGEVSFVPSKYIDQLMTLAGYARIVRKATQQNKLRISSSE